MSDDLDLAILGHRARHYRRRANMTLADVSEIVGKPVPYLSQLENGRLEPKVGLLNSLADALDTTVADLVDQTPPNRRAELELELAAAQATDRYQEFGLPTLKPSAKLSDDVLEHLITLWKAVPASAGDVRNLRAEDRARVANLELREEMRCRNNYFSEIEKIVNDALESIDYPDNGPLSERHIVELAQHFGFRIERARGMPSSARSITDQRNRIIYIPLREEVDLRAARSVVLQTLGHYALDHSDTQNFADYLRQRVESNYFSAAALIPEKPAVDLLQRSKEQSDISIEDLKEAFYVSYEMAAHRFTNLATEFLDLEVHFLRCDPQGVVSKAYENDGIDLPTAPDGSFEGMRVSRHWGVRQAWQASQNFMMHYQHTLTDGGEWWCASYIEDASKNPYAVSVGTTSDNAMYFRGGDTIRRIDARSSATQADPDLIDRWKDVAWPSAAQRSYVLTALPASGREFSPFPGVDLIDVYRFLDRQRPATR